MAGQPSYTLTEQNALAVAQICVRLTGGSRAAAPRQRTLAATIDWSYELRREPERTLFQRLSVFAGGWSLEAAEGIPRDRGTHLNCLLP